MMSAVGAYEQNYRGHFYHDDKINVHMYAAVAHDHVRMGQTESAKFFSVVTDVLVLTSVHTITRSAGRDTWQPGPWQERLRPASVQIESLQFLRSH